MVLPMLLLIFLSPSRPGKRPNGVSSGWGSTSTSVPPLDGGNVMLGLLPPRLAAGYSRLREYGFIILYALMFTGAASAFITPPTNFMMRMLIP